jgi:hypothetical protein
MVVTFVPDSRALVLLAGVGVLTAVVVTAHRARGAVAE